MDRGFTPIEPTPPLAEQPHATAGWYPVDEPPGAKRWWDGTAWTDLIVVPIRSDPPRADTAIRLAVFALLTLLGVFTIRIGGLIDSGSADACELDTKFQPWPFFVSWGLGVGTAIVTARLLTVRLHDRVAAIFMLLGAVLLPLAVLASAAVNCSSY